jgi:hypothetical protein
MNSRLGKLRDMRGGWRVGHRNAALFYVSMTLHALRADEKEVRRVLAQHLEGMAQPAGDRLTAAGHQPTGPVVEAHLLAAGIPASRKSVLADMAYVGCPSPLAHRSKPEGEAQATLF